MATVCYYPDQSISPKGYPCQYPNSGFSACCGAGAYCTSAGLCLNPGDMTTYRGACTDKSWQSNDCPKFCLGITNALSPVFSCGYQSYTCTLDRCNGTTFSLAAAQISNTPNPSSSPTASASSSSTSAASTSACPTSSASPAQSCAASVGEVAGVGAGVGIPLLLALIAALFLFLRERKRNKSLHHNTAPAYALEDPKPSPEPKPPVTKAPIADVNANSKHDGIERMELSDDRRAPELDGTPLHAGSERYMRHG